MTVHKCDICGKEIGVWISLKSTIGATYNETNVANLLDFVNDYDLCIGCAEKLSDYILKVKRRGEF